MPFSGCNPVALGSWPWSPGVVNHRFHLHLCLAHLNLVFPPPNSLSLLFVQFVQTAGHRPVHCFPNKARGVAGTPAHGEWFPLLSLLFFCQLQGTGQSCGETHGHWALPPDQLLPRHQHLMLSCCPTPGHPAWVTTLRCGSHQCKHVVC